MKTNYAEEHEDMLAYFWQEKRDISRYSGYDEDKIKAELPHIWAAWVSYRTALRHLNTVLGGGPDEKLHWCDREGD